jgi:hypothetical protein
MRQLGSRWLDRKIAHEGWGFVQGLEQLDDEVLRAAD